MSERPGGRPNGITLHLVPEAVWREQVAGDAYEPEAFAAEGFVHTTLGEETLIAVANRYYRDDPQSYLVVDIDLDRVSAPVRFDEAGPSFPHVYGPIETAAVVRVRRAERGADGRFMAVGSDYSDQPVS